MSSIQVGFTVNGHPVSHGTRPTRTLLNVLREDLPLMGVKDACGGEGECGACTVLMNDVPVNSCLVMIGQVDGRTIETIEALSANGKLHCHALAKPIRAKVYTVGILFACSHG
jgi:carbon-monoxide dehydrogenase small subunit